MGPKDEDYFRAMRLDGGNAKNRPTALLRTLAFEESHRESMRLDGLHEQAITRPLSHDELVQLLSVAAQARVAADLAGQGDDLARAA